MSDFVWIPNTSSTAERRYRTLRSQYGDGYSQVATDGINSVLEMWHLVFDPIPSATYNAILTFIDSKGGYQSFTWTPLASLGDNVEIRVRCASLKKRLDGGDVRGLELEFERIFIP